MLGIVELGKRSIESFFEHRMVTYAEQLSYRGLFGFFPFLILVFVLLAVLRVDVVFDRLIEAAMGAPPQQIPESLEPVAEEGRTQAGFLRQREIGGKLPLLLIWSAMLKNLVDCKRAGRRAEAGSETTRACNG